MEPEKRWPPLAAILAALIIALPLWVLGVCAILWRIRR